MGKIEILLDKKISIRTVLLALLYVASIISTIYELIKFNQRTCNDFLQSLGVIEAVLFAAFFTLVIFHKALRKKVLGL